MADRKNELLDLVRAVYSAGFRNGCENGTDRDRYKEGMTDPDRAWEDNIQWMIDTDTSQHLDISDPESWSKV